MAKYTNQQEEDPRETQAWEELKRAREAEERKAREEEERRRNEQRDR
ncbi:hypothetical protein [Dactylosporangium sp. NPDC050588]